MELTAPGLQARDRGWKKLYCILHGTHLLVYKFDPHRYPGRDTPGVIPLVSEADSEAHLHVHVPGERRPSITVPINAATAGPAGRRESIGDAEPGTRRGSGSGPSPLVGQSPTSPEGARRASISSSNGSVSTTSTEKDASLFPSAGSPRRASVSTSTSSVSSTAGPSPLVSHFQHNSLVKQYTLQNAESGLAADYMKRKNVVRVRAEGEQFLLQTENARDVVDWIEVSEC